MASKKEKLKSKKKAGNEYRKNMAYSLRKIGSDYVETHMPAIHSVGVATGTVIQSFRRDVLRDRSRLKIGLKAQSTAFKSYMGDTFANMKADLKSGRLYNDERFDSGDTTLGGLMNSYLDDDSGGAEDPAAYASQLAANINASSSSINAGFRDTGRVITGSTDYIGQVISSGNTQSMIQTSRFHMEQMNVLGNLQNLAQAQVNFNLNEMKGFIASSMEYYDKTTSLLESINQQVTQMNETNAARFGTKKGALNINPIEEIFSGNGIDLKAYGRAVKQNFKNNSGGTLGLLGSMMGTIGGQFKNNPLGMLMSLGLNAATPKSMKNSMGKLNDSVEGLFASFLMGMNNMAKNSKNGLFRSIGEMLGIETKTMTKPMTASYKNQALTLEVENKKNKAITEVIPQYLSEITRALSGVDKIFDYNKGVFVDRKKRKQELDAEDRKNVIYSMSDSRRMMSDNLFKLEGTMSKGEKQLYQEDLDAFMYFLATIGENVDPSKFTYDFCKRKGLELRGGKKSFDMMKALYLSLSKDAKARVRKEQLQSIGRIRSMRQMRDKELVDSGEMLLYTGFYDGVDTGGGGASRGSGSKPRSGSKKPTPRRRATRGNTSASSEVGNMTVDELLERINSSDVGPRPAEPAKSGEKSATDELLGGAKDNFVNKFKKVFDIKQNKVLNGLFGETGFFPGVLDATANTISDIMYGDDPKKNKGMFGELFSKAKSVITEQISNIKTVIQGKFGDSKLYKKIWGDKKTGEPGMLAEFMTVMKKDIIEPIKGGLKKHVLDPLGTKFKSFYEKNLKKHVDKLSEEAKKYGKQAYEEATGSAAEFYEEPKPAGGGESKPGAKRYKVTGVKKKATETVQDKVEQTKAYAEEIVHKVQIVAGQGTVPVLVKLVDGMADEERLMNPKAYEQIIRTAQNNASDDLVKDGVELGKKAVGMIRKQLSGEAPVEAHAKGGKLGKGLNIVGERGPELIASNGGGTVIPNSRAINVNVTSFGSNAQETIGQTAGYIAGSNIAAGQSGGGGEGGAKPKQGKFSKLFGFGKKAKEKVEEKGGIGGLWDSLKNKVKNSKSGGATAGAVASSLLGLGPMPGLIVGAIVGDHRKMKAEKARMKAQAEAEGKEFDKEAWKARKKELKDGKKGGGKGAVVGAVASSLLGLGPLPGIIVGSIIGKKLRKEKDDVKAAEEAGQPLEEAQKKAKWSNFLAKFKGAAIGGAVSTLLGLGPLPGILVGTILKKRKQKKKEEKEAKEAGEAMDEQTGGKKGGGIKNFFKKAKGAIKGALASTLLGLGPIPGAIVGAIIAKKKITKAEEKEAQETGESVENETEGKKGFFGKLKDKFTGAGKAVGGFFGKLKNKLTKQAKGEAPVEGHAFGGKTGLGFNIVGERGPEAIIARGGDTVIPNHRPIKVEIEGVSKKASGLFGKLFGFGKKDKEERKKAKAERQAAKKTQKHTRQLTQDSDDPKKTQKNVSNILNSADTSGELASLEQSTSIMANANSIGNGMGAVIQAAAKGEGGGFLSNLLSGLSSIAPMLSGLLTKLGLGKLANAVNGKQTLKQKAWNFLKNNAGDIHSMASIGVGINNIKEGKELMQGDNLDQETGSGKIVRGSVQTASGALRLTSSVAKGVGSALGTGAKTTSVVSKVAKAATKGVQKVAKTPAVSKLTGWISKGIKAIISKIGNLVGKKGGKIIASSADNIAAGVIKKGAGQLAAKTATFIAKWSNVAGWALVIAQLVADFGTGWADVKNIMQTAPGYEPPLKLKIVAGLSKAISGLLLGLIPVDWLTGIIFGIIGSDEEKEELQKSQEQHKAEYDAFIKAHPEAAEKGLTMEKYNQIQNRTTWGKIKGFFTGTNELEDYIGDGDPNAKKQSGFSRMMGKVGNWFKDVGGKVWDWTKGVGSKIGEWGKGVGAKIGEIGGKLKDWGAGVVDKAKDFGAKALDKIKDFGSKIGDKLKDFGSKIKDTIGDLAGKLKDFGANLLNKAKDFAAGVVDKVKGAVSKVKDAVGGVVDKVKNSAVGKAVSNAVDKVKNSAVGKAVANVASKAKEGVKKAASAVANGAKKAWGAIKGLFGGRGEGEETPESFIPYYNQKDPRWRNQQYGYYHGKKDTVGDGGCGPTTAAMMMNGLTGSDLTPGDVSNFAYANGYKSEGTDTKIFDALADQFGIGMQQQFGITEDAINAMTQNIPVAMVGSDGRGTSPFGKNPHYILGTHADEEGINIYDPLNKKNNRKFGYDKFKGTNASIIPQTAGITIPTETAKQALNKKNANKVSKAVQSAKANIQKITSAGNGRGEGDDTVGKIAQVANEMLDTLHTISDTLIRMEENAARNTPTGTNHGPAVGATSWSSKENSVSKTSAYNKAVTA